LAGTEIHLFNLIKGLKDIGYNDLEVISMSGEGEIYEWVYKIDIPVLNLRMRCVWHPLFLLDFLKMTSYLRRKRPDIVHTYLDTANVFGVLAAKLAGVKTIITSRRDLGVFRSKLMETLMGFLSNRVYKVVCVCKAAAAECLRRERLNGYNITVIHNGIKFTEYQKVNTRMLLDHIVFCNVAVANRKEKGHEDLVRAFALVLESLPNARLKFIGGGHLLPGLKNLAGDLGISEKITFVGHSNDVPSQLKDATVFILPSHSEGISNALLEAMAMGIPVIATKVGGNTEVVIDSLSGFLVEPQNPEVLANAMLSIITNKKQLLKMGEEAQKRIGDLFTFERMIQKYHELYSEHIKIP
ncbi:MAG TPA: hypothetical protein DEG92_07610, partial [Rikenellaceae bacterium]|nr:hypothetical protein [Rikenellaceae bacterium]